MRQRFFSPALLLALMWSLAYPQQTIPRQSGVPAQRQLTGKVYSLSPTGEKKPEPNLIVIMEQTGKGDDTNDLGIFHLDLPPAFKSGESVNLSIKKEGWRLPADGKVRIPYDLREIVEVEIVPTSAAAFFTDAPLSTSSKKSRKNPPGKRPPKKEKPRRSILAAISKSGRCNTASARSRRKRKSTNGSPISRPSQMT